MSRGRKSAAPSDEEGEGLAEIPEMIVGERLTRRKSRMGRRRQMRDHCSVSGIGVGIAGPHLDLPNPFALEGH
jgi:hypothetical protein